MNAFPSEEDIVAALPYAAERGEMFMLYQPKISLHTGELAGVEALMRWQSSQFGLLLPAMFIPAAERSGSIDELSEWGLSVVLNQWLSWRDQGFNTNIAFNISALTLRDIHFPDILQRMCHIRGVPCDRLTIEVTEGATQHVVRLLDTITRFRIKGLSVEIDDFGTGFSSLHQLRQLPYTGLKIDKCFVEDVTQHAEARVIVKSVTDLAHGLGLIATAEGVEDHETLMVLKELGCDAAQGFVIGHPMRAAELAHWMLGSLSEWRQRFGSLPFKFEDAA